MECTQQKESSIQSPYILLILLGPFHFLRGSSGGAEVIASSCFGNAPPWFDSGAGAVVESLASPSAGPPPYWFGSVIRWKTYKASAQK